MNLNISSSQEIAYNTEKLQLEKNNVRKFKIEPDPYEILISSSSGRASRPLSRQKKGERKH